MHAGRHTRTARWLGASALAAVAACGGPQVHRDEAFSPEAPYHRKLPVTAEQACKAAGLALLSQGYDVPESGNALYVKATKAFQPDEDIHVILEVHAVCSGTGREATLYANAVETRYDLKKSRQAAGISVPSVGAISLPWGSTTEALVKVAGKTVEDEGFYARFFSLVEQQLGLAPPGRAR